MNLLWEELARFSDREKFIAGLSAVLAFIGANALRRFQKRRKKIRYTIRHTKLTFNTNAPLYGPLEITYAGARCSTLYSTNVALSNDCGDDLENIDVLFWFRNNYQVYQSFGALDESGKNLMHTPDFATELKRIHALPLNDRAKDSGFPYVSANSEFRITALNRDCVARFQFLVHATHDTPPDLVVTTERSGVRLVFRERTRRVWSVPVRQASSWGIVAGSLALLLIPFTNARPLVVAGVFFLMGAFAAFIGAATVRFGKLVLRLLS